MAASWASRARLKCETVIGMDAAWPQAPCGVNAGEAEPKQPEILWMKRQGAKTAKVRKEVEDFRLRMVEV
jgi:hypothetical protein